MPREEMIIKIAANCVNEVKEMFEKKGVIVVDNWQIHTLSTKQEIIDKVYSGENATPQVFTGTVVEDPTGKYRIGNHMRSSLIVKYDKEKGTIETLNTRYKVLTEGDSVTESLGSLTGKDSKDIGDAVMGIFY